MEKERPSHETNLFCEILADPVINFMETLQRSKVKYLNLLLLNLKKMFSAKKKNLKTLKQKKKETKLEVKVKAFP